MIQLIVPAGCRGGVYDFACRLRDYIGSDKVTVVDVCERSCGRWRIDDGDRIFLQMSGYGFHRRGAPRWLVKEVEARRDKMTAFGVFFHEVYAFGPPWRSSFWLSPVQRSISRRLVELSDFWITSRELSAGWLGSSGGVKPHSFLPVFSTIGEPSAYANERSPNVVIFGSPGLRAATYMAAGRGLFSWALQHKLQIHDIGAPIEDARMAARLRDCGVIEHGFTDVAIVRSLLNTAIFGLLAYPAAYVAKSSVFAAYCAHGVCPVLFSRKYAAADGLSVGTHYLKELPDLNSQAVSEVSLAAFAWYQPHRLSVHAKILLEHLGDTQGAVA